MASEESNTTTSKPQSRTSQACQRCRTLKARCLPSDQQGICQRCLNSKRDCIWPEIQQRTRLPRGPSRISQVEKKIDGLVARIAKSQTNSSSKTHTGSQVEKGISHASDESSSLGLGSPTEDLRQFREYEDSNSGTPNGDDLQIVAELHEFQSDSEDADTKGFQARNDDKPSPSGSLTESLLANPDMETYFEQYRSMAPSFPFVPIDPSTTVQAMCKRKPMVMLAIAAVASWRDAKAHFSLEKQYRREVALRTFVGPGKNFELLQSLLIFIAWYHLFVESRLQSFVMLQTIIGLMVDLRLDPHAMPHLLPGRDMSKRVRGGKDGQRAFLGCYYLSSMGFSGLRATNPLKVSSYTYECVSSLSEALELETDAAVVSMINARYLEDQTYGYMHPSGPQIMLPTKQEVLAQVDHWQIQLSRWKADLEDSEPIHRLNVSDHGIGMEMYHSAFRHLCRAEPSNTHPSAYDAAKITLLTSCLEEGRSILDTLLSVPTEDFPLIPYPVWIRMPRNLILLSMLTVPSTFHIPQWDLRAARDRVRLDLFIESLCFRMQTLTTFNPPAQPTPDFWLAMKLVLQSVGKWYKRSIARGGSTVLSSSTASVDSSTASSDQHNATSIWPNTTGNSHEYMYTPESMDSSGSFGGGGAASTNTTTTQYGQHDQHHHLQQQQQQQDLSAFFAGSSLSNAICPMMRLDAGGPEMDQFMDSSFWGDGFGSFDGVVNFDFSL